MGIIGSIRKHSWIAVLIVGIAIVAFIIGDLTKNRTQPTFAKVDGDEITYDFFNSRLLQLEEDYNMRGENSYAFRESVWQEILQEHLLSKEMTKLGIEVSDAEVSDMYIGRFIHQQLQQQFTNPQTGAYDRAGISNYVQQLDVMPDTSQAKVQWLRYQERLRDDRQRSKYINMLYSGMYMPNVIAAKIAEMGSKSSDLRVAALRYSDAGDVKVDLTEEDYQKYFKEHEKMLNYEMFRMDSREQREVAYFVFTAQPSQKDMTEIQTEVGEWWSQMQTMDDKELADFVNIHGGYDSTYIAADKLAAPLDSIVRSSHTGAMIQPVPVMSITKADGRRYTYGQYVLGKVLATSMRPDSMRVSIVFIPNQNYPNINVTRTPAEATARRDSAMNALRAGASFEDVVRVYSEDTTRGGDQDWRLDGEFFGELNEAIIHHGVGEVFNFDLPEDRGYFIVKVTGKTTPHQKYRLALASKAITPSVETERGVRDQANQFASQHSTCQAMIDKAQSSNIQVRSALLISMSDSLNGFSNTREAVRWAFDEKSVAGSVSGVIYQSDYSYIVVGLREIYVPGHITFEQARPFIEQPLRIEKIGEQLLAKANDAMKNGGDINAIAANLGVQVDTIGGVSFGSYLGRFGMEPKVVSAVAKKKDTGVIKPIQGASGVYVISVDGNSQNENVAESVANIRYRYEQRSQEPLRYLIPVLQQRVKIVDNRLVYM